MDSPDSIDALLKNVDEEIAKAARIIAASEARYMMMCLFFAMYAVLVRVWWEKNVRATNKCHQIDGIDVLMVLYTAPIFRIKNSI